MLRVIILKRITRNINSINYGSTHKSCHHVIYLVSTWLKATEMEDNSEAGDNKVGSNLHVKFVVLVQFERIFKIT